MGRLFTLEIVIEERGEDGKSDKRATLVFRTPHGELKYGVPHKVAEKNNERHVS